MSVFPLKKATKDGSLQKPMNCSYSEDYTKSMYDLYLTDEVVKAEDGHYNKNYRLHARNPHNQDMAFFYDIDCPKWGGQLKQIGSILNYHDLGLYTCKKCNKR